MNEPIPEAESRCILVVDDDDDVRPLLCSYVNALGFKAFPASSGTEAVEVLGRHADEVRVALVDLHMPGMGGWGTVAALKRLKPDLRCCLVSGDVVTPESMRAAGVHSVIEKPFRADV